VTTQPAFIPRPLVRFNQWTILLSVILTWVSGAYGLLLIPLIANLLGVLVNFNPIIRFGKIFLKRNIKSYVPEDLIQQRFNSTIATACLALSFIGYSFGLPWLAYSFSIMVALASFIAILGFCIGCFLFFQISQYRYRRAQKQPVK